MLEYFTIGCEKYNFGTLGNITKYVYQQNMDNIVMTMAERFFISAYENKNIISNVFEMTKNIKYETIDNNISDEIIDRLESFSDTSVKHELKEDIKIRENLVKCDNINKPSSSVSTSKLYKIYNDKKEELTNAGEFDELEKLNKMSPWDYYDQIPISDIKLLDTETIIESDSEEILESKPKDNSFFGFETELEKEPQNSKKQSDQDEHNYENNDDEYDGYEIQMIDGYKYIINMSQSKIYKYKNSICKEEELEQIGIILPNKTAHFF
jgi:hypothetical protein